MSSSSQPVTSPSSSFATAAVHHRRNLEPALRMSGGGRGSRGRGGSNTAINNHQATTRKSTTTTTTRKKKQSNDSSLDSLSSVTGVTTTGTGGTATMANEVTNLVKSLVGAGVLGLSSGIASFANSPTVLPAVTCMILLIGSMCGYCFSIIGRICAYTGATSYRDAWTKSMSSASSSSRTALLPAVGCLLVTFCSVLAYSMILADTVPQLCQAYFGNYLSSLSRSHALLGITIFAILPLCLLKDMSSLAPFSLLGTVGMVYTVIAMGIRHVQHAYDVPDGMFVQYLLDNTDGLQQLPTFGTDDSIWHVNTFVLASMLSSSLMAHYNAPMFYNELHNNTLERYNTVVIVSFVIAIVVFSAFAVLGFLTFGASSNGLILNNYATQDTLISTSRLAVAASIIFGYPLAFVGVRDGVLDLLEVTNRSNSILDRTTVTLLTIVTALALYVQDLRSVLSLSGATWGTAIIYVLPAVMIYNLADSVPSLRKERPLAVTTGLIGLTMGIVGTVRAIKTMQSS